MVVKQVHQLERFMQSKLDQGNGKIKGTDPAEGNCHSNCTGYLVFHVIVVIGSFFTRWKFTSGLGPKFYFTDHAYYFLGDRIPDAPDLLQSPESLEPLIERLSEERSLSLSPSLPLSAGPSTAMFAVVVVVVFPLRSFIRRRHRLGTSINEIHKILASSDLLNS